MIYYYSGTGNSAYVTRELSKLIDEKSSPVSIPSVLDGDGLEIRRDGRIGFVFPIYSWGIPPVVVDFVNRLPAAIFEERYIWAVCTCGDEAGIAMRQFASAVKRIAGRPPHLEMSIIMPNNYVLLPGFNVDSEELASRKLDAASDRLKAIADNILNKASGVYDVHEGSWPSLRTKLVYPLFKRFGINPNKWKANNDCISCGRCVKICPTSNIVLNEGQPKWSSNCLSCCACFHVCPQQAISYGSATKGKGQYIFPGYPFKP